jgi:hypothetical protein
MKWRTKMFDHSPNDYDFPVEMQDVFSEDGKIIPTHKVAMRLDTLEPMGLHSPTYKLSPYGDAVDQLMSAVDEANISKDYKLTTTVLEGGRKLKGEILFPDLTIEPDVGDIVAFRIQFFDSYSGAWAFQQIIDALRLWCLNGCVNSLGIAQSWGKHTKNLDVSASAGKLAGGMEFFLTQEDTWKAWRGVKVEQWQAEHLFRKTLAKRPHNRGYTVDVQQQANVKQLDNLLSIYAKEKQQLGANKWALYNAMTHWSTHTDESSTPVNTRKIREAAVADAMTHAAFAQLA